MGGLKGGRGRPAFFCLELEPYLLAQQRRVSMGEARGRMASRHRSYGARSSELARIVVGPNDSGEARRAPGSLLQHVQLRGNGAERTTSQF